MFVFVAKDRVFVVPLAIAFVKLVEVDTPFTIEVLGEK
jgi:hypothetical protein